LNGLSFNFVFAGWANGFNLKPRNNALFMKNMKARQSYDDIPLFLFFSTNTAFLFAVVLSSMIEVSDQIFHF